MLWMDIVASLWRHCHCGRLPLGRHCGRHPLGGGCYGVIMNFSRVFREESSQSLSYVIMASLLRHFRRPPVAVPTSTQTGAVLMCTSLLKHLAHRTYRMRTRRWRLMNRANHYYASSWRHYCVIFAVIGCANLNPNDCANNLFPSCPSDQQNADQKVTFDEFRFFFLTCPATSVSGVFEYWCVRHECGTCCSPETCPSHEHIFITSAALARTFTVRLTFYASVWCLDEIQHFCGANILTPYSKSFPTSLRTLPNPTISPKVTDFGFGQFPPIRLHEAYC
jgi:hypothetical protein